MENVLITVWLTWSILVAIHFAYEVWFVVTRGYKTLPRCRRWWCPEGILNLVKGIR